MDAGIGAKAWSWTAKATVLDCMVGDGEGICASRQRDMAMAGSETAHRGSVQGSSKVFWFESFAGIGTSVTRAESSSGEFEVFWRTVCAEVRYLPQSLIADVPKIVTS